MLGSNVSHFDPQRDLLALHYDCSPDPDDLQSLAADRTLLEALYGTTWLASHVLPVIGTFGRNTAYKSSSCERVARAVWGSASGFLRAHVPSRPLPPDGSPWPFAWVGSTPVSSGAWRRAPQAIELAVARWSATLLAGGQIYVKEGGQSDFSHDVLTRLEARWAGVGACVHVVQHARWNEEQNGENVTAYMEQTVDYLWPTSGCDQMARGCARGVVTSGNGPLAAHRGPWNAAFVAAANASWMGCGWRLAFDEYAKHEHYGSCWHGAHATGRPAAECIDFSDVRHTSWPPAPPSLPDMMRHAWA